jgi:hypothetical protein
MFPDLSGRQVYPSKHGNPHERKSPVGMLVRRRLER